NSFFDAVLEPSPSFLLSIHSLKASFISVSKEEFKPSFIISSSLSLTYFVPTCIPKPNSAASSNNGLIHAGPLPSALVVYAIEGADAPQIDEQPVALDIIILSPNNCVRSLI